MRRRRRRLRRQWRQRDRSSLWSPSGNKKAPDLFRRGSGPDDAIVQLRAHVSRSPTGLSGFGGAFGARHHGAGTYGGPGPASTAFGAKIGFNEVEQDAVVTQ